MQLCRVRGEIWGSRIHPEIEGYKILRLSPYIITRDTLTISDSEILALDQLDASAGENVIISSSSRVRDIVSSSTLPIKSVTIAIVDSEDM